MNEVQAYTPQNTALASNGVELGTVATQATQNTVDLVAWANELGAAHTIASAISRTEFVPKDFRGDADKTATAILYGKSVGLDPLAALSNIFVVHGRPAMYSRTMVALAQRAGVEFERSQATEQQVTVRARRRGGNWQEFTWSIQRADKAGYTSNAKYKTDPIGMLTAKAFTEAVRVLAPDVLMGISVGEEVELGDYDDTPTVNAPKPVGTGRTVQRKQRQTPKPLEAVKPAPEPQATEPETVDEQTGEIVEETPAPKLITKMSAGKIANLYKSLGVTDKTEMLSMTQAWLQDENLKSVMDLTDEQGKNLATYLESEVQKEQAQAAE